MLQIKKSKIIEFILKLSLFINWFIHMEIVLVLWHNIIKVIKLIQYWFVIFLHTGICFSSVIRNKFLISHRVGLSSYRYMYLKCDQEQVFDLPQGRTGSLFCFWIFYFIDILFWLIISLCFTYRIHFPLLLSLQMYISF